MIKNLHLSPRLYNTLFVIFGIFIFSVFSKFVFYIACIAAVGVVVLILYDTWQCIVQAKNIYGLRNADQKLSLGDTQDVTYTLTNQNSRKVNVDLYDDMPTQLQYRTSVATFSLDAKDSRRIVHQIKPNQRGIYQFGEVNAFVYQDFPGFVKIKHKIDSEVQTKVYPSIIQMKKYAMQIFSQTAKTYGIRRIRTIGENDEFEHIRPYMVGDNIKSINWQATSRKNELLVNQFQDTRSQSVYCVIDKGRSMEMPFDGLALVDYAINSSLVISNIVLQKYDKAGLITFDHEIDALLAADAQPKQLEGIMQILYNQQTAFKESDFKILYHTIRKKITKRSILLLFTNFEDKYDLERNLPYIKLLNKYHLLVVVSFINVELEKSAKEKVTDKSAIYKKTIASSLLLEKEMIIKELDTYGIQTILTKPENLSINIINKYLEIKAKRMK